VSGRNRASWSAATSAAAQDLPCSAAAYAAIDATAGAKPEVVIDMSKEQRVDIRDPPFLPF